MRVCVCACVRVCLGTQTHNRTNSSTVYTVYTVYKHMTISVSKHAHYIDRVPAVMRNIKNMWVVIQ